MLESASWGSNQVLVLYGCVLSIDIDIDTYTRFHCAIFGSARLGSAVLCMYVYTHIGVRMHLHTWHCWVEFRYRYTRTYTLLTNENLSLIVEIYIPHTVYAHTHSTYVHIVDK